MQMLLPTEPESDGDVLSGLPSSRRTSGRSADVEESNFDDEQSSVKESDGGVLDHHNTTEIRPMGEQIREVGYNPDVESDMESVSVSSKYL